MRFSLVTHGRDSPEGLRDVRGFATKFYTSEGNWDLVGNNIPVYSTFLFVCSPTVGGCQIIKLWRLLFPFQRNVCRERPPFSGRMITSCVQVFFIRDGFKFPDLVHALRPNPANNIQEVAGHPLENCSML